MFDGIKNSFKSTVDIGENASKEFMNMAKEIKDMPYKKLKPIHIAYLLFAIIAFAIIAFVIFPIIN